MGLDFDRKASRSHAFGSRPRGVERALERIDLLPGDLEALYLVPHGYARAQAPIRPQRVAVRVFGLLATPFESLSIGQPVELEPRADDAGLTLLVFRPG